MRSRFAKLCGLSIFLAVAVSSAGAELAMSGGIGELVMFDSKACTVCRKFNAEIGNQGYAARKNAQVFPLRRIDIHGGTVDIKLARPVTMTPTFVFVEDGAEIARFVGYPGRNYFSLQAICYWSGDAGTVQFTYCCLLADCQNCHGYFERAVG